MPLSQRRPGRPPTRSNQRDLHFFVHCKRVEAYLAAKTGRAPTDTQVLKEIIKNGGHRQFVAGDREQIRKTKIVRRSPKHYLDNDLVSATKIITLKTLQNSYSLAKRRVETDPAFREMAQELLAQFGVGEPPVKDTTEYAVGWRPRLGPLLGN